MLSTVSKYKMEFLQTLQTYNTEQEKHIASLNIDPRNQRQTRLDDSHLATADLIRAKQCNGQLPSERSSSLPADCAGAARRLEIHLTRRDTGLVAAQATDVCVDQNYVSSISIHHSSQRGPEPIPIYTSQKLEDEIRSHRLQYKTRCRSDPSGSTTIRLSSPYMSRLISLPAGVPPGPYNSALSLGRGVHACLPQGGAVPPYRTTLKLSGVLTSFKHRTFRTRRSRVRFCAREESTDDLTKQLANIKLDISSVNCSSSDRTDTDKNGKNMQNFTQIKPYSYFKERHPHHSGGPSLCLTSEPLLSNSCPCPASTDLNLNGQAQAGISLESLDATCTTTSSSTTTSSNVVSLTSNDLRVSGRPRLILEPRSRHISLESEDDPSIHSELTSSLNRLDLEEAALL